MFVLVVEMNVKPELRIVAVPGWEIGSPFIIEQVKMPAFAQIGSLVVKIE